MKENIFDLELCTQEMEGRIKISSNMLQKFPSCLLRKGLADVLSPNEMANLESWRRQYLLPEKGEECHWMRCRGWMPAGHQAWTPHAQPERARGFFRRFGRREMKWTGHLMHWGIWGGGLGSWQSWGWIDDKHIKNKVNEEPRLTSSRENKLVQKKKNN